MDWRPPRSQWALDRDVIHLNHGAFGAVPLAVRDVQQWWRNAAEINPTRFYWRTLPVEMTRVREVVSRYIGAGGHRCVLMPNLTNAMTAALATVPLTRDDEVLITSHTYVGVRAAARVACNRVGAGLVVAGIPPDARDGAPVVSALLDAVTTRTRVAIVDHITSPTALLVDVAAVTAELRQRGVVVIVDGAQAAGAVHLEVEAIGADFYTGVFHKWTCSPRGAGFLAVHPRWVDKLVPAVAGAHADEGFPSAFEWWGTTDYSALLTVPAALEFVAALGSQRVRLHNRDLVTHGRRIVASALGLSVQRHSTIPMASFAVPGIDSAAGALRLREELSAAGAEVSVVHDRGTTHVRLSAHLYNDLADFHKLADLLTTSMAGQRLRTAP